MGVSLGSAQGSYNSSCDITQTSHLLNDLQKMSRLDLCPTLNITKKEELWSLSKVMFQNTHVQSETTTTTTNNNNNHHHNNNSKPFISKQRPSSNPQFQKWPHNQKPTELPKATMASRSCFSA